MEKKQDIQELNELLSAYFLPNEIAELLTYLGRREILNDVPPAGERGARSWFFQLVDRLAARGELDQDLFKALEERAPKRKAEIRAVAALFVKTDDARGKLRAADLERLLEASLAAGLDAWERQFSLLDQFGGDRWRERLHRHAPTNLRATLAALNEAEGDQLERWVGAAKQAAGAGAAAGVFEWYRCHLAGQRSQSYPLPASRPDTAPADAPLRDISEARHRTAVERLVPFSFLAAGQRAGAAVARVRFVKHVGGHAVLTPANRFQGTGVLVAPGLLLTSWWLARASAFERGEDDFLAQCAAASFRFDGEDGREELVVSRGAAAWDAALNVVLLRIGDPLGRPPVTLRATPPRPGEPLSVIQHPLAGDKRIAPRELRDYAVADNFLTFQTGERIAFAGAPWFDDAWQMVALQGKISHSGPAIEYRATLAAALVDALRRGAVAVPPGGDAAAVWDELRAAQPALA